MDVAAANSRNLEPIFLNISLDFKYGFDEAKPTEDERIEAYEYRSECFTYDETEGNWTRHQPARNRTYIVEATEPGEENGKPYPGSDTEYHNRYFDRMMSFERSQKVKTSKAVFKC